MSRAALLSVSLPPGVRPTAESTENLIKKFLRECNKDSLVYYLYENSAMSRRFTKRSVKERQKRLNRLRNSKKYNEEMNKEGVEAPKKKKKNFNQSKNVTE